MRSILLFFSILACMAFMPSDDEDTSQLIYCSYACEGMAQLGTDYCELIADSGEVPRVVVVRNQNCHFAEREKATYEVDDSVVENMRALLAKYDLDSVNGYREESGIDGGHEYRFHVEYSSGRKIHAAWHTHTPKREAATIYSAIENFFAPWVVRQKAEKQ